MRNIFLNPEFSFASTQVWFGFILLILSLLMIDIFLSTKSNTHHKKFAIYESIVWIGVALSFNGWLAVFHGKKIALEFLTGYLVEKSLSIDNLFIIFLIFSSLKIPIRLQHRVLFYGIAGAFFFRTLFITVGAHLIHRFHWVMYLFGLILVVTAIKFLIGSDKEMDPKHNWSVRLLSKFIKTTSKFSGNNFFSIENGKKVATPLMVALIVIEATDIIFAVDSIPAIFAITKDTFIVFSSNILAILGLRSLYFVIADWVSKLRYLKPGLATILGYIGVKMLVVDLYEIPSWVSLLVIVMVLTTAALSSWYVDLMQKKKV